MNIFSSSLRFACELFYPSTCVVCKKIGPALCNICIQKYAGSTLVSHHGFYACASYSNSAVRSILIMLKRFPAHNYAHTCAKLIILRLRTLLQEHKHIQIALVPLPRTRKNVQEFGHDQSFLISEHIHTILQQHSYASQCYKRTLINLSKTPHHTIKTKQARIDASAKKFKLTSKLPPKDSLVILIDDIITSGASMDAARTLLYEQGYTQVIGIGVVLKD